MSKTPFSVVVLLTIFAQKSCQLYKLHTMPMMLQVSQIQFTRLISQRHFLDLLNECCTGTVILQVEYLKTLMKKYCMLPLFLLVTLWTFRYLLIMKQVCTAAAEDI